MNDTIDSTKTEPGWDVQDVKRGVLILILVWLLSGVLLSQLKIDAFLFLFMFNSFFLVIVMILAINGSKFSFRLLGLSPFKLKRLGDALGILIAFFLFNILYGIILKLLGLEFKGIDYKVIFEHIPSVPLLFFVSCIYGPLMEEIFFRGFIFAGLCTRYGKGKAAAISAFVFALGHISPDDLYSFIPVYFIGTLLAVLYHRSRSIFPGFLAHGIYNFIVLAAAYSMM
jgi:membrane protease YdiL (CAAX protease family)